jgi:hypothetical protein
MKTYALFPTTVLPKSCCLWDNLEKYDRAKEAEDDNVKRRMCFACWIAKAMVTRKRLNVTLHVRSLYR